ncbi:YaiI/YqxD family protein, partial [Bifidobacterium pseudocatenulatum]|nr:YaiI/YqxD family protein [Bifidobacterium pseudocatenulatum]
DFLVTQDYGLASLVLPKGVRVFHQSGKEFDESNIGSLLEQRYHSGKMRKAGLRTRGPKPFTKEDHAAFRLAFEQALAEK